MSTHRHGSLPVSHDVTATLLLSCDDAIGIIATVTGFVNEHGGIICSSETHRDEEQDKFFQRLEFEIDHFDLDRETIRPLLEWEIGDHFSVRSRIAFSDQEQRVGVLASKPAHCLHDLLSRWRLGELPGRPVCIISNHPDHTAEAEYNGLPYHHLPVTPETRSEQEEQMIGILEEARVDLVVLARYMQILTPRFLECFPNRVINIHHSFLPAFPGGSPYRQAYLRGVKVVGATAHYATAELDQGPIIEQDVTRVSHRDSVTTLVRRGRDLERVVLARAVQAHLEHRVLVVDNRAIVFG
ncbi:MAG: formyltetrahydrofolate deformylase [Acidobacteria bacterium]|nr:formyltetrahydrofolate deformylase [Acidobacteriota bacterium]